MKKRGNFKYEVYCFVARLFFSLIVSGRSFFWAAFARRLCRCTTTFVISTVEKKFFRYLDVLQVFRRHLEIRKLNECFPS